MRFSTNIEKYYQDQDARLDAFEHSCQTLMRRNQDAWYATQPGPYNENRQLAVNRLEVYPVYLNKYSALFLGGGIIRVACEVRITTADTGAKLRCCLYSDLGLSGTYGPFPGTLLHEDTTGITDFAVGFKESAGALSWTITNPGLYWLGVVYQRTSGSSAPSLSATYSPGHLVGAATSSSAIGSPIPSYYYVDSISGSVPATWTSSAVTNTSALRLAVKID